MIGKYNSGGIKRGDPISANWLNEVRDAVLKGIRVVPPLKMTFKGTQIVISCDTEQIVPKT